LGNHSLSVEEGAIDSNCGTHNSGIGFGAAIEHGENDPDTTRFISSSFSSGFQAAGDSV
jgi:hypothetical protein